MQDFNTPRPPLVEFEARVAEARDAEGKPIYTDVHFVKVTPHGSKDRVEKLVQDWFSNLEKLVREERFPADWLRQYKAAYAEWVETGNIPIEGTPLKNWPVLTPAELKRALDQGLRSVEDLAAANEETMQRLGMGGRALKQKARDWLEAQSDTAPLVSRLDAMRQTNAALEVRLAKLEAHNAQLQGLVDKLSRGGGASPEVMSALVTAKQTVQVEEPVPDHTFAEMEKTIDEELS